MTATTTSTGGQVPRRPRHVDAPRGVHGPAIKVTDADEPFDYQKSAVGIITKAFDTGGRRRLQFQLSNGYEGGAEEFTVFEWSTTTESR